MVIHGIIEQHPNMAIAQITQCCSSVCDLCSMVSCPCNNHYMANIGYRNSFAIPRDDTQKWGLIAARARSSYPAASGGRGVNERPLPFCNYIVLIKCKCTVIVSSIIITAVQQSEGTQLAWSEYRWSMEDCVLVLHCWLSWSSLVPSLGPRSAKRNISRRSRKGTRFVRLVGQHRRIEATFSPFESRRPSFVRGTRKQLWMTSVRSV